MSKVIGIEFVVPKSIPITFDIRLPPCSVLLKP